MRGKPITDEQWRVGISTGAGTLKFSMTYVVVWLWSISVILMAGAVAMVGVAVNVWS